MRSSSHVKGSFTRARPSEGEVIGSHLRKCLLPQGHLLRKEEAMQKHGMVNLQGMFGERQAAQEEVCKRTCRVVTAVEVVAKVIGEEDEGSPMKSLDDTLWNFSLVLGQREATERCQGGE